MLDDLVISEAIVKSFMEDFIDSIKLDVAIVGAGPAGLMAGYCLAKEGRKVVIFEKKLSIGGGMWGGGMMFNKIVIQKESKRILDELGVKVKEYKEGYYLADSIEAVSGLTFQAVKRGLKIFNLISAEDVMLRKERVTGIVINWSSVELANLHVDPLSIGSRVVVDATGHSCELARLIERKVGSQLKTESGGVMGEKPMWAEVGERTIVDNTKEIYAGLYVAGMAANAVFGGPRMGPIFGGMLLSGEKVARMISERLEEGDSD